MSERKMRNVIIVIALIVCVLGVSVGFFMAKEFQHDNLIRLVKSYCKRDQLSSAERLAEGALIQYPNDKELQDLYSEILAALNEKKKKIKSEQPAAGKAKPLEEKTKSDSFTIELKREFQTLSAKVEQNMARSNKYLGKMDEYMAKTDKKLDHVEQYLANVDKLKSSSSIVMKDEQPVKTVISPETQSSINSSLNEGIAAYESGNNVLAKSKFQTVLKIDKEDATANTYYAACLYKENPDNPEYKELMIKSCQEAIKKEPTNALAHFTLGAVYQGQGAYDLAMLEFKTSLALNPANPDSTYALGQINAEKENYREAIRYFQIVLQAKPDWAVVNYDLARAFEAAGNRVEAKKYYRQTCVLDKGFFIAFQKMGQYAWEDKEYENAFSYFQDAIGIKKNWQSLYGMAKSAMALGKKEDAKACYLSATALNTSDPALYKEAVELLGSLEDYSEIAKLAEPAIRLNPDAASLWFLSGLANYKAGNKEKAEKDLLYTLSLDAGNYEAMFYLGELSYKQKRFNDAKNWFKKVISTAPYSEKAADAEKTIKNLEEK